MDSGVGLERSRELFHSLRDNVNSVEGESLEFTNCQRMRNLCILLLLYLILQLGESVYCERIIYELFVIRTSPRLLTKHL